MILKNCLLIGSFLCALHAQAQVNTLFKYSSQERIPRFWEMTSHWGADSVSVFKSIDSVKYLAIEHQDPLLAAYAELFKINYQQSIRKNIAERIAIFKKHQAQIEQSPYPVIHASFYFFWGNLYFWQSNFNEAFKLTFRAKQIFEQIGYENIPEASLYLSGFFGNYYYFEDYANAIKYSILTEKYNHYNVISNIFTLNNRGMAYLKMHDYANAEKTFLQTIALSKAKKNNVYVGIASGNYGNTLRLQGKFKDALPYLYADINLNEKEVPENSAITCLYIAHTLLQSDSIAKAKLFINRSTHLQPNSFWRNNHGLNFYEVQALYHRKIGDFKKSVVYLDSLMKLKDSLKVVFSNKLLLATEGTLQAEKYINDLNTIELEKQNAVLIRNTIIISLLIVALVIIYSLNQRRQKEKQVQAEKQKRAEDSLAYASAQLEQYLLNLKDKNELIEKISAELAQRQSTSANQTEIDKQTEILQHRVILTDSDWQQFKQLFEQVYPHFFNNLLRKFQDLSPAETRLLALLKLNITSKEMAFMLGVSIESLRKSRYRLRKKLEHLQADTDLKGLIEQLDS